MKKIVLFIDSLGSGGAQRRVVNLANLFQRDGYDIEILIYHDDVFYEEQAGSIKIHIIEDSNKIKRLRKILYYLQKTTADIVVSFLETPNHIALLAKALGSKWDLITTESSSKEESFRGLKNRFFNHLEIIAKHKICNSYNAASKWRKNCPWLKKKITTIYNPVIMKNEEKQTRFSADKVFRIIVPASYQKIKNPLNFIDALTFLDDGERSKVKVDWYGRKEATTGDASVFEECKRKIDNNNLNNVIELHGESKDIYGLMMDSDAVGLFSIAEGMPNAICEGMMLGKPIIMSKVSDYETLVNGNGFLCDPFDIKSIASAIQSIITSSEEEYMEMSIKSRQIAHELFERQTVAEQWEAIF